MLEKYEADRVLKREEILSLLKIRDEKERFLLRELADKVRQDKVGDEVHIRGIIEFSNHCRRRCLYCGINCTNKRLTRYRMAPEEIVEAGIYAADLGIKTVVLQSGEDPYYSRDMLADVIREIKKKNVAVTLSVGERPEKDYQAFREAGADRYLLKFETSNPDLYRGLHPDSSLAERLKHLKWLREAGYQLGSGFMIGLPGQTLDMLADDILLMRELRLEMAGVGPFIPHPSTPLKDAPPGDTELSLNVLAISRLVIPWAHLPATTALSSLSSEGRAKGLRSGANVLMPNMTPVKYRKLYEIYPHKAETLDTPEDLYQETVSLILSLGRKVAQDPGHSLLLTKEWQAATRRQKGGWKYDNRS
jgi:biotin synthase